MHRFCNAALAAALMLLPVAAGAQTASPTAAVAAPATADDAFARRAATLPDLLGAGAALDTAFAPNFLTVIPVAQVRTIFDNLRNQYGAAQRVISITPSGSAGSGTVVVGYDRATVTFTMAVDAEGRIAGLRIADLTTADDSFDRLSAELAALPGAASWGVYRLSDSGVPALLHGSANASDRAIGSAFKLAILGALDAEIAARRMRWSDVVRIERASVPSSTIIDWPTGAPITLHSLATLMISVSDNRATDILLHHVGRERVEAFARRHGGLSGPNAFPLLSTLEATVLKNPGLGEARSRWLAGDEAARRAVLREHAAGWTPANVDYGAFADGPADIESIEWFASPDSLARLLGWFATRASDDARAILAVNSGIPPTSADAWDYVGYKGGSEPGVMAMNFLLRARSGEQFVVAMAWNDSARAIDEARFAALAQRAVALLLPGE